MNWLTVELTYNSCNNRTYLYGKTNYKKFIDNKEGDTEHILILQQKTYKFFFSIS